MSLHPDVQAMAQAELVKVMQLPNAWFQGSVVATLYRSHIFGDAAMGSSYSSRFVVPHLSPRNKRICLPRVSLIYPWTTAYLPGGKSKTPLITTWASGSVIETRINYCWQYIVSTVTSARGTIPLVTDIHHPTHLGPYSMMNEISRNLSNLNQSVSWKRKGRSSLLIRQSLEPLALADGE